MAFETDDDVVEQIFTAPHTLAFHWRNRLENALRADDIEPDGLDLEPLVGELIRRELVTRMRDAGAYVETTNWGRDGQGEIEVRARMTLANVIFFRTVTGEMR